MGYLIDILSAFIWVVCTSAPWLLAFYLVAAIVHSLRPGKACPYPRIWQSISGMTAPQNSAKEVVSPLWRGLEYGLNTLPGTCIPQMLLGSLLATGIMLTVPWDYTYYESSPFIETIEFVMLVLIAVLLRLPLCASLPGALALLAKDFSAGLALFYLLLSPFSILACEERKADVPRIAYLKKVIPRLLSLDIPLALICFLLGWMYPNVRTAGRLLGPPVICISVTSQICGAILCALILRLAILRLIQKWD